MIRDYFYFVDRDGVLWHDGTVLEDEVFLRGFFAALRANDTGRHAGYPWLSPCGRERNYVAAEATPVVFRRLAGGELIATGGVKVALDPRRLRVRADGRLYHEVPGLGPCLLRPGLVVALADCIEERAGRFVWVGEGGPCPITAWEG